MSYSTRAEVREMLKDDALNAIIGDTFEEDKALGRGAATRPPPPRRASRQSRTPGYSAGGV